MLASAYGKVYVLRLGHRRARDKRVTTHVGLVARAFGANGFILAGECDEGVLNSLKRVLKCWGGEMFVSCTDSPRKLVKEWRDSGGEVIHLTMYGMPLHHVIGEIRSSLRPKLVVVGAEKVDWFFYENADYNVSITNQPHSEIAALALFLDRLFRGRELMIPPSMRGKKIVPSPRGKKVMGGVEC